ncbi:hypothetical protein ABKN59_008915 [Abortiporus biennis]
MSTTMRNSSDRVITGLSLTMTGPNPSPAFEFSKTSCRVINIGRKSAQSKDDYTVEEDRALFRCAVVSRKHATITFAEYGNVYVTDLHSHHGTHILRRGESVSMAITPETLCPLGDGDVLTFGKTVGKDQFLVRPVTVKVELKFSPLPQQQSASPITITTDATTSSPSPTIVRTCSSGRFGAFLEISDDSSSSSDSDSDIEEIQPTPSNNNKDQSCTNLPSVSELFGPSSLFNRGIRNAHSSTVDLIDDSPVTLPRINQPHTQDNHVFYPSPSPEVVASSPEVSDSVAPTVQDPEIIGAWPGSNSDEEFLTPHVPSSSLPEAEAENKANEEEKEKVVEDEDPVTVEDQVVSNNSDRESETASTVQQVAVENNVVLDDKMVEDTCDQAENLVNNEPELEVHQTQPESELLPALMTPSEYHEIVADIEKKMTQVKQMVVAKVNSDEVVATVRKVLTESLEDFEQMRNDARKCLQDAASTREKVDNLLSRLMPREATAVHPIENHDDVEMKTKAISPSSSSSLSSMPMPSLKRKRDLVEEQLESSSELQDVDGNDHVARRRPTSNKRRKISRVVSTIAQTTAIATVGAVAAWSALAFM